MNLSLSAGVAGAGWVSPVEGWAAPSPTKSLINASMSAGFCAGLEPEVSAGLGWDVEGLVTCSGAGMEGTGGFGACGCTSGEPMGVI